MTIQQFQQIKADLTGSEFSSTVLSEDRWFTFKAPTTASAVTTMALDTLRQSWFDYKFEIIAGIIILYFIILKIRKWGQEYQNHPENGFTFAIEIVDREQRSIFIKLDHPVGHVQAYHIFCNEQIQFLQVGGFIRPFLEIIWNVKFFNQN